MKSGILTFIKYSLGLVIAGGLLWYVFHDWELDFLLSRLNQVNYWWVLLSVVLSIISHAIRAYRWNLLLNPLGYKHLTIFRTFLAVMIGYFVNLLAPRAGEITRCGIMKKNDGVSMSVSLGSVVAERIVDLGGLIIIILLGMSLQSEILTDFFTEKVSSFQLSTWVIQLLLALGLVFVIVLLVLWWQRLKIMKLPFYIKLRSFAIELYNGLTSVLKLENKIGFWSSTVLIWVFYFAMAYVVVFAIPSTSHLSLVAGLSILIMGGLAMSAPVQGGFGTYHLFVSRILVLYGISKDDGLFFATLLHSSQTISILLFGGLSFVISLGLKKEKSDV